MGHIPSAKSTETESVSQWLPQCCVKPNLVISLHIQDNNCEISQYSVCHKLGYSDHKGQVGGRG